MTVRSKAGYRFFLPTGGRTWIDSFKIAHFSRDFLLDQRQVCQRREFSSEVRMAGNDLAAAVDHD
ncbi:hypothetical protein B7W85_26805 [Allorhizobium ampelinum]|nr:hypothetical protein [Agrobacterium vitis]OHZ38952.1 hypothetical protein BBL07_12350 [Agrobacterium vitis]OVE86538.1 hypothetical protein B7W85_26805 [Allorhizobium ampelinum]